MRKFLIIFMFAMIGSFMASASNYYLTAYRYAQKKSTERSYSNPVKCDLEIVIDTENELINVGTARTQYYVILEYDNPYVDKDGDIVMKFYCVDEEGISCLIRFIKRKNNLLQLYVDYSNISWVYDVH